MSEDSGVEHRVDVGIELVLSLEVDFIDWTAPLEDLLVDEILICRSWEAEARVGSSTSASRRDSFHRSKFLVNEQRLLVFISQLLSNKVL